MSWGIWLPKISSGSTAYGWHPLGILAGRTLRDLAVLREEHGDGIAALSVPARVRFSSPGALDAFLAEPTREIDRLLAKYHDESAQDL